MEVAVEKSDCPNCRRLEEEKAQQIARSQENERSMVKAWDEIDLLKDRLAQAEHGRAGYQEDYENAWHGMRMIREALESHGPVKSPEAVLRNRGPEPIHEAAALVDAINHLLAQAEAREAAMREALEAALHRDEELHTPETCDCELCVLIRAALSSTAGRAQEDKMKHHITQNPDSGTELRNPLQDAAKSIHELERGRDALADEVEKLREVARAARQHIEARSHLFGTKPGGIYANPRGEWFYRYKDSLVQLRNALAKVREEAT